MGLFDFLNKKQTFSDASATEETFISRQSFSTPFLKIGKGDLTKPFISDQYIGHGGYVRFGADNLFPQIINQLYFTSPLHGGIIEFKTNTVAGGGFEIQGVEENLQAQTDLKAFIKKYKLKKLVKSVTRDYIMHENVYFILNYNDAGVFQGFERINSEKVRLDKSKKVGFVSPDWSKQLEIETIPVYKKGSKAKRQLFVYQADSPGQDTYALPMHISCFNWVFLDGEASILHKSNIQESIFPSLIVKRPKRFKNDDEKDEFVDALKRKKGADEAGFVWVLTADNRDGLPDIETVQTSGNDKLMMQTDERMDSRICQAHQIDPIIMGIRVSGKLGSGQEVAQSYATFEKNYVLPIREEIEAIFNELLDIAGVNGIFVLNNYQIIDGQIVDKTETVEENEEIITEK